MTRHAEGVQALRQAGWQHGSLTPVLKRIFADDEDSLEAALELGAILPDGFKLDWDKKILHLVEVEDTHPLKGRQLARYCALWWIFDGDGEWDMHVSVFDVRDEHLRQLDFPMVAIRHLQQQATA